MGTPKGVDKEFKYCSLYYYIHVRILYNRFLAFPGVLEGLGSYMKLVGTICTYPGTWSRVIAEKPPGEFFHRVRDIPNQPLDMLR